jgi:metal-dependent amidase/aminoacylase/carboxypeptidase family protein
MARVQQNGGLASYMVFGTDLSAGHHNEKFDFDEQVMTSPSKRWRERRLISRGARCVMQENYAFIADAIDTRCRTLTDIADEIWDHPETRFEEFWSAERLAGALEAEGFS